MRRRYAQHGFTLLELVVVMAIMGILVSAVFPLAEMTLQREREHELRRALWEIRDAIDAHKRAADAGMIPKADGASGYPASLEVLVAGVPSVKEAGRRFYFMRRVPRDPFADPGVSADRTWGLRSFQSPAHAPRPGDDVYDVYSQSARTGLNGVPLKEW